MAVGEPGWISMVFSRPGVLRGAAARVTASTCKKKTGVVAVGRAFCWRVKTAGSARLMTVAVAPFGPPCVMICT